MHEPSIATACVSLTLGLLLLYICLFTLTIPHWSLKYLRLALAPCTIRYFWDLGHGPYEPFWQSHFAGFVTIGLYGVMRVLEHSVLTLWDSAPPQWVIRTEHANGDGVVYSLPHTLRQRCFYAFDLLTSQRGSSWSADLEWNWIPLRLHLWATECPPPRQFLMNSARTLLVQYLLLDLSDTINKSHNWDLESPYPVTSLPVLQQFLFSVSTCAGTTLSITIAYTVISAVCVLCGSSPSSWPPMFDSPFLSTSLKDFWSRRWHWMFRRVFDRLSEPFVRLSQSVIGQSTAGVRCNVRVLATIRSFVMFALSTILHLAIMHRLALQEFRRRGGTDKPSFWDSAVLKFFMCQPLGLLLESTGVVYVADWIFPAKEYTGSCPKGHRTHTITETSTVRSGRARNRIKDDAAAANEKKLHSRWEREAVTRLYAWLFLLWTGRWWADKWVKVGMFHEGEPVVPLSILRGLWNGRWLN